MSRDLVSIIMPSYNTANYIIDSVRSIQAQTYENWELLIVDDCSTDNTIELLNEYITATKETRIRVLINEKNSGAAVSRNYALREATGRWIAFLDSDDLWTIDKLEKQISFMQLHGYYFSYTNYMEIDQCGIETGKIVSGPNRITKIGMINYCWPGCLTVMYDRTKVGLIQIKDIKKNNDYAMWLKVSNKAECYLLDEVLGKYRRGREGSISSHTYWNLVKWHYRLFNEAENKGRICSLMCTLRNIFFGIYKKSKYVKVIKK